jgi:glycosyltransferase involved in cell wall biosynthesis
MSQYKTLCLNMIVKNEVANLESCLGAVADHIACWVIGDTGSTDGTQDFIRSFFAKRNLPGELHSFSFNNFAQARNEALKRASASSLTYDYLLLADADMELVVENEDFRARLEAPGYLVLQRAGAGLAYWNTRLVQRNLSAHYHGVTHEYLEIPGEVLELREVWYNDHASGSNRVDKFERDIRLLTEELQKEPDNPRYWFYLAQSYRDAGQTVEAKEAYAKRAEMGGWEEETWHARLEKARCLRVLGDDGGFLRNILAVFQQRPQRVEPLHDLAHFYRERGMNDVSLLFSEPGLALPRPEQQTLFVEDYVYNVGIQEEYAIAGYYAREPRHKERGHGVCNALALNREIPEGSRTLARSNVFFYAGPAVSVMPSFTTRPVGFTPPDDYRPVNPSIACWGEQIFLIQRGINFDLTMDGRYETPNEAPVHTRNFLLHLSGTLDIRSATEILPPVDMPEPAFGLVLGFEDMRLFPWRDQLWCSAAVRELTPEGWYQQVLARIDRRVGEQRPLMEWRVLEPEGSRRHEKNWMPQVNGDTLHFIYSCDPTRVVDEHGRTVTERWPALACDEFRGGSQLISFDGGWLALVHEVHYEGEVRRYQHRFVWFDAANVLKGVSRRFFFHANGIEYASGLTWHPGGKRLLISYGVGDREAWIAAVEASDVRRVLEPDQEMRRLLSTAAEH